MNYQKLYRMICLRHPKTTSERRDNQDGWGRPCRNKQNLPNAWDDMPIHHQRTWKKFRKHQWKE